MRTFCRFREVFTFIHFNFNGAVVRPRRFSLLIAGVARGRPQQDINDNDR
jgi:hypothetical protein